jgi:YHS domain-containing protein
MIRAFFVEFLFPLLVFLVLRTILRNLFAGSRRAVPPRAARPDPPPVPAGGELKKDPVCGTYVSTAASVTRTVHGQVVHFCSKECRDRYVA